MSKKKISVKDYVEFWKNLYPEIKPLPSTIQFWEDKIKEILKKNKNPQALVLGVTPEIRDLLTKHKIKTTCLDLNPIMIKAMESLVKRKNPKERIIKGDWLKMPFKKDTFDFIISDCPQDNIPYKSWNKFFQSVFQVLKPSGYWLLGATLFKGFKEGINLSQFIEIYRKNPKVFTNSKQKFYYLLKLSSCRDFNNRKTKTVDWIKVDKELEKLYKKGLINRKELNDLSISTKSIKLSLACKWPWVTMNEFCRILKKNHFYVIGYREDDIFPAGCFRQAFILKKH